MHQKQKILKEQNKQQRHNMAKLCPKGKAAAKRKFKVYPSAYANMYASAVCSGYVKPGGMKNRKKAMGGGVIDMTRMKYLKGGRV